MKDIIEKELKVGRCDIVKMVHLGQSRNSRPRLLLVILASERMKWNVLRAASNLHSSICFSKIYLSSDLTPKERDVNRKLREELAKQKKMGGQILVIRKGKREFDNLNIRSSVPHTQVESVVYYCNYLRLAEIHLL